MTDQEIDDLIARFGENDKDLISLEMHSKPLNTLQIQRLVASLENNTQIQKVSLGFQNFSDPAWAGFFNLLETNTRIKNLIIFNCYASAHIDCLTAFERVIKYNASIQELVLSASFMNQLETIADALKENVTITKLSIGSMFSEALIDALKVNKKIREFKLMDVYIDEQRSSSLKSFFKDNVNIKLFDIRGITYSSSKQELIDAILAENSLRADTPAFEMFKFASVQKGGLKNKDGMGDLPTLVADVVGKRDDKAKTSIAKFLALKKGPIVKIKM